MHRALTGLHPLPLRHHLTTQVGYRNFFSSVLAYNQRGFAAAIKEAGIPRSELYICGSVLSNRARGYEAARKLSAAGCADNMAAMATGGIDYLDMIMLDYPGPDADSIRGQWAALEDMKASGLVGDLAVSNFSPAQLDVVLATGGSPITCNQLPVSLANPMPGYIEANADRGVLVQSWSPLSRRVTAAICPLRHHCQHCMALHTAALSTGHSVHALELLLERIGQVLDAVHAIDPRLM